MNEYIKRIFSLKIRRRRRYRVKSGAYVILSNSSGKYQIDDIGYGGLSFHCVDNGLKSKESTQQIKIVTENQDQALVLGGRIVAESETGELIFEKKRIKRRSIQFDRMSTQHKKDLENFIRNNADTGP